MPIPAESQERVRRLFASLAKRLRAESEGGDANSGSSLAGAQSAAEIRFSEAPAHRAFKSLLKAKLGLNGQVTREDLEALTASFARHLHLELRGDESDPPGINPKDPALTLGQIWDSCSKSLEDQVADWLNDESEEDADD